MAENVNLIFFSVVYEPLTSEENTDGFSITVLSNSLSFMILVTEVLWVPTYPHEKWG